MQELANIVVGNRIIAKNDSYSWGKTKTQNTKSHGSCVDISKNFTRTLFKRKAMKRFDMAAGDILVIYSVCRIAASVTQLLWTMKSLRDRGIRLLVRRQHIDTADACWGTAHHRSPCVRKIEHVFKRGHGVDVMARRKHEARMQGRFKAPDRKSVV